MKGFIIVRLERYEETEGSNDYDFNRMILEEARLIEEKEEERIEQEKQEIYIRMLEELSSSDGGSKIDSQSITIASKSLSSSSKHTFTLPNITENDDATISSIGLPELPDIENVTHDEIQAIIKREKSIKLPDINVKDRDVGSISMKIPHPRIKKSTISTSIEPFLMSPSPKSITSIKLMSNKNQTTTPIVSDILPATSTKNNDPQPSSSSSKKSSYKYNETSRQNSSPKISKYSNSNLLSTKIFSITAASYSTVSEKIISLPKTINTSSRQRNLFDKRNHTDTDNKNDKEDDNDENSSDESVEDDVNKITTKSWALPSPSSKVSVLDKGPVFLGLLSETDDTVVMYK